MARKSNHQRHVAQLRREKNVLRRQGQAIINRLRQSETLLMFALAQAGGSLTISKGVGQTVMKNLATLGYKAQGPAPGREDLDYVVIQQTAQEAEEQETQPAEPAMTITKVEDETDPEGSFDQEQGYAEGPENPTPPQVVAGEGQEPPVE